MNSEFRIQNEELRKGAAILSFLILNSEFCILNSSVPPKANRADFSALSIDHQAL
jgi:hypothetical protein